MTHRVRIATEIGTGHRHDVCLVPRDELAEMRSELIVRVRAHMVELVHGDETAVKTLDAKTINRKAERSVGTR